MEREPHPTVESGLSKAIIQQGSPKFKRRRRGRVIKSCLLATTAKASCLCLPWKSCCTSTGGTVYFTLLPTSSCLLTKVRAISKKIPVVSKEMLFPFILITSLFSLWGFANDITNPMVAAFGTVMEISTAKAALVQLAFYGGYATIFSKETCLACKSNKVNHISYQEYIQYVYH